MVIAGLVHLRCVFVFVSEEQDKRRWVSRSDWRRDTSRHLSHWTIRSDLYQHERSRGREERNERFILICTTRSLRGLFQLDLIWIWSNWIQQGNLWSWLNVDVVRVSLTQSVRQRRRSGLDVQILVQRRLQMPWSVSIITVADRSDKERKKTQRERERVLINDIDGWQMNEWRKQKQRERRRAEVMMFLWRVDREEFVVEWSDRCQVLRYWPWILKEKIWFASKDRWKSNAMKSFHWKNCPMPQDRRERSVSSLMPSSNVLLMHCFICFDNEMFVLFDEEREQVGECVCVRIRIKDICAIS